MERTLVESRIWQPAGGEGETARFSEEAIFVSLLAGWGIIYVWSRETDIA